MPICSTTKIVVGSTTMLDFGDYMENEVSNRHSQFAQGDSLIRSRWAFNEGRKNATTEINWSRWYRFDPNVPSTDTDAIDAARLFQAYHIVPGVTWPTEFQAAGEFEDFGITVPEGRNTLTMSFEYGYGSSVNTLVYTNAVITSAVGNIAVDSMSVLFQYSAICTEGDSA